MIGDNFGFNSFQKYYHEQEKMERFMIKEFEVSGFNNDSKASYDINMISRFRNCFMGAITDQAILPKYVVIVPDNDIIKFFKWKMETRKRRDDNELVGAYECMLTWLMNQYSRLIMSQKDYLPKKAKKGDDPKFLWIEAPLNKNFKDNDYRMKFNTGLRKSAEYHTNNYTLALKKLWDEEDSSLYCRDDKKYMAKGYETYWESVDKAVKYADTLMLKKEERKKDHHTKSKKRFFNTDRFHWRCR